MKVFTKADVKLSMHFLNVVFSLKIIENFSRDISEMWTATERRIKPLEPLDINVSAASE